MTEATYRLAHKDRPMINIASGKLTHSIEAHIPTSVTVTKLISPPVEFSHPLDEDAPILVKFGEQKRTIYPGEAPTLKLSQDIFLEIAHYGKEEAF